MEYPNLDFAARSGRTYNVKPEKILEWQQTFPEVDVPYQLRLAWQWNEDNPDQRKLHQHLPRFLFSWLNRSYTQSTKDKTAPGYMTPYKEKKTPTFLGMLRRRYSGRTPKSDAQLLVEHFQAELRICRQCEMSHDLLALRERLGRYLWLDSGMEKKAAEKLSVESLPLEI